MFENTLIWMLTDSMAHRKIYKRITNWGNEKKSGNWKGKRGISFSCLLLLRESHQFTTLPSFTHNLCIICIIKSLPIPQTIRCCFSLCDQEFLELLCIIFLRVGFVKTDPKNFTKFFAMKNITLLPLNLQFRLEWHGIVWHGMAFNGKQNERKRIKWHWWNLD